MAKLKLTQTRVNDATCPLDKKRADWFDTDCKGLVLEARITGGKTYHLRYQDSRGHTRQLSLADARDVTLTQARALADKARNQVAMGEDPKEDKKTAKSVPTFASFIEERYLPYVKGYKKSWDSDDSYLRNHILPAFGKKYMDEVRNQDVIAFHHGVRAKGYAVGTANRMLILLRYAFNLAVKWDIPGVKVNPTKNTPLFEDLAGKKERYLSKDEAQRIFEAVRASENTMLQYIVPMLILTGARKREVLDARWQDFDLEHSQWRIPTTKSGRPRYVPLSDGVLELLTHLRYREEGWVFANPKTGKPFVSVFISWNSARKKAGLADVRMHDLRHSFASFLVNAGRTLYEVQKILGHTQVKTTQRYAHLSQDTLRDAANAANNALGNMFMSRQSAPTPVLLAP
jgi:integrase